MHGVSKITCADDMILISIAEADMACMAKTLQELAQAGVVVDMISQSAPTGGNIHFSFTASNTYLSTALQALGTDGKMSTHKPMISGGYAKIYLFGEEMIHSIGVAARALQELEAANIDIHLITTSDLDISILIHQENVDVATEVLSRCFSL